MGREGIRRRTRARHLRKLGGPLDWDAFGPEHSPLTIEGRIEGTGRIARGLRDASPTQLRFVARLFAATMGFLVVLGFAMWFLGRLVGN